MTSRPLIELKPRWMTTDDSRSGMGVGFDCPHCGAQRLAVWFSNPLDGGPPAPANVTPTQRWERSGHTFETLTLSPSIDASGCGHWHGFIHDGIQT